MGNLDLSKCWVKTMKVRSHSVVAFLGLLSFASIAAGQVSGGGSGGDKLGIDLRHNWWNDIEGFINQQNARTLELVEKTLTRHPPELPEPFERQLALHMIDGVLHEADAATRPAVQTFFHARIIRALGEIQNARISQGARIWKLYNHGFVVRTPTVTIGFDLVRGHSARAEGFALADETLARIVDQCDVLFISHRHGDHADDWVAQAFIDRGKPVVAPPEVWEGRPIHGKITHLEREAHRMHSLPVGDEGRRLDIVVYPGHQGRNIQNNVPLVFSPEGISFAQTGDQSYDLDFDWIDEVGERYRVDVLMPNCWTNDIVRMARGFDPELIITGHENEMGHTIDHREPYWLTYSRLRDSTYPLVLMTWGESYHYIPK